MTTAQPSQTSATQGGPADKFVEVNGLKLHYLDWGGNGTPLVALHGVGSQGHTWDSFAAAARDTYHIYALDQRGFGDSDHAPDANYGTTAFANDLKGFLDALGLEKVIIVGHSMGGHNAMAFTARNPGRVIKLVVVDLAPGPRSGAGAVAQQNEFDSIDELLQINIAANPQTPVDQLRLLAETNTKRLPNGKLGWKRDAKLPASWQAEDLWDEVAKIEVPVLVQRGTITRAFTVEDAERMTKVIPNCALESFEGAGHTIQADQPEAFNQSVLKFLA